MVQTVLITSCSKRCYNSCFRQNSTSIILMTKSAASLWILLHGRTERQRNIFAVSVISRNTTALYFDTAFPFCGCWELPETIYLFSNNQLQRLRTKSSIQNYRKLQCVQWVAKGPLVTLNIKTLLNVTEYFLVPFCAMTNGFIHTASACLQLYIESGTIRVPKRRQCLTKWSLYPRSTL